MRRPQDTLYGVGRSSSAASPPSPMFAVGSVADVDGRSLKIGALVGGITAGVGVALRGAAVRRAGARLATVRFAAARFGAARFGAARLAVVFRALVLPRFAALGRAAAPRGAAARLDEALLLGFALAFAFGLFGAGLRAFGFLAAMVSTPLNFSGNSRITAGMLACHRQQALCHER
jgi:hypothetical protein